MTPYGPLHDPNVLKAAEMPMAPRVAKPAQRHLCPHVEYDKSLFKLISYT